MPAQTPPSTRLSESANQQSTVQASRYWQSRKSAPPNHYYCYFRFMPAAFTRVNMPVARPNESVIVISAPLRRCVIACLRSTRLSLIVQRPISTTTVSSQHRSASVTCPTALVGDLLQVSDQHPSHGDRICIHLNLGSFLSPLNHCLPATMDSHDDRKSRRFFFCTPWLTDAGRKIEDDEHRRLAPQSNLV